MNENELKDYLSALVSMEKEVFLQNQLLRGRQMRVEKLAIPKNYRKPIMTKPIQNDKEKEMPPIAIIGLGLWTGVKFGAIPGAIIAFIACGLFKSSFANLFAGAGIGSLIVGIIVTAYLAIAEHDERIESLQKYDNELKQRTDEYNTAITEYEIAVKADAARVQEERITRDYLAQECKGIYTQMQQSKKVLDSLYDMNIVFPKYRNFVMISSIYEYISTDRAKTLGDAYNILESEMRMDRISSQLNTVIAHLEEIRDNQYIIYSALQEIGEKLDQINASSQRIETEIGLLRKQGDALHDQIADLQASSSLTLYYNELNYQQNAYLRRWVNHHTNEEVLV